LLPEDLPVFQSSELRVLDMDTDWRQTPAKVCSTSQEDGRVFSFLACEQDVRGVGRGAPVVNHSIDHIRTKLEEMLAGDAGKAQVVCGVVLDHSPSVKSATLLLNVERMEELDEGREQLVAGLLLPWVSK